jgi:molybdopterin synthase sulfur carrier subunit
MDVQVRLLATLRRYRPELSPGAAVTLEVPEGTTVRQVAAEVGIPDSVPLVVMVNAGVCRLDYVLTEGDTVSLFQPVAGG